MRGFDPDDEGPEAEGPGVQLRDADSNADAERALALLDAVTAALPGSESRPGQRTMAERVARAWATRTPAAVEAGTGIGKSLAYLVPSALAGTRVVIATATKNLQDQLATKDAPLVASRVPGASVAVLKGRQNYLCRLRAAAAGAPSGQLALDDGTPVPRSVSAQLRKILDWSSTTAVGDRDELDFEVDERAWRQVSVTPQECLGRGRCPHGEDCFTERARDRAADASLVVVNTHLYAAHLASGQNLLPAHELLVLDEAHESLDIFASLLGTSVAPGRARALAAAAAPLLGPAGAERAEGLRRAADRLAAALLAQWEAPRAVGLDESVTAELGAAGGLVTAIVDELRAQSPGTLAGEERRTRALGPGIHLAGDLARVTSARDDELVYLRRTEREVTVELNLVEVAARLRAELWGSVTPVLSSATIPDALPRSLGLDGVAVERVPSPFDYRAHSLLYVPEGFPDRRDASATDAIVDELVALVTAAGGRTLALFTNRKVMAEVADRVAARVDTPVLVQGAGSRARLLRAFRDEATASLFAVASFWQGVDVPGHSLSLVVIDRLPFVTPADPLAQARRERSANGFWEVDLPRAAVMLAQGVGRLIRTREDRGVVAVLDTRLATASYRSALFAQLPPMRRTRRRDEVLDFLRGIAAAHS